MHTAHSGTCRPVCKARSRQYSAAARKGSRNSSALPPWENARLAAITAAGTAAHAGQSGAGKNRETVRKLKKRKQAKAATSSSHTPVKPVWSSSQPSP